KWAPTKKLTGGFEIEGTSMRIFSFYRPVHYWFPRDDNGKAVFDAANAAARDELWKKLEMWKKIQAFACPAQNCRDYQSDIDTFEIVCESLPSKELKNCGPQRGIFSVNSRDQWIKLPNEVQSQYWADTLPGEGGKIWEINSRPSENTNLKAIADSA